MEDEQQRPPLSRWPYSFVPAVAFFAGIVIDATIAPWPRGQLVGSGFGLAIALSLAAYKARSRMRQRDPDDARWSRARMQLGAGVSVCMAVHVAIVVLISWIFDLHALPTWTRAAAALSPALPIGGVIIVLLRYLTQEPDEFQRVLMTRAVLLATGVTFFLLTAWGFLEFYVRAPHFPTGMIILVFWGAFPIADGWVRRTYR